MHFSSSIFSRICIASLCRWRNRNDCAECTICFPYGSRRHQCDFCVIALYYQESKLHLFCVVCSFVANAKKKHEQFMSNKICGSDVTSESNMLSRIETMLHLHIFAQPSHNWLRFSSFTSKCVNPRKKSIEMLWMNVDISWNWFDYLFIYRKVKEKLLELYVYKLHSWWIGGADVNLKKVSICNTPSVGRLKTLKAFYTPKVPVVCALAVCLCFVFIEAIGLNQDLHWNS